MEPTHAGTSPNLLAISPTTPRSGLAPPRGRPSSSTAAFDRHYGENNLVCVPETERTAAQWQEYAEDLRMRRWPFLVAGLEGEVVGYGCVHPWKPGPSFRYVGEVTANLEPGHTDHRLGDALMQPLIAASRKAGIRQLFGAVAQATAAPRTDAFGHRYGFEECGLLRKVARKDDQRLDLRLYLCPLDDPESGETGNIP
ncbi:GNAT family N-acetyltransferase [Streptomyces sp. NPDC053429]|uniref:GNAT family N-acetyltransferase n=1 Tax=Streptomyces sp. NPDC053429 TaxID=3365702 RepID=UPI0037D0FFFD